MTALWPPLPGKRASQPEGSQGLARTSGLVVTQGAWPPLGSVGYFSPWAELGSLTPAWATLHGRPDASVALGEAEGLPSVLNFGRVSLWV